VTTLLNMIADGIQELMQVLGPYHERALSFWELRSEYRRLKRMHACDAKQMFSNSRMLPIYRTHIIHEDMGKGFWQHTRRGASFDCCTVHRSRKQFLLSLLRSTLEHEPASPAQPSPQKNKVVELQPKSEAQRQRERKELMDKIFGSSSADKTRQISGKEFNRPDMASLRYQLYLTQQRLEVMQSRALKRAS
jgi:hypothetical protein